MLIIGRRAGESIFVGEDVEIRVMDVTPSRVKLGILAPRQVAVWRGEVREAARQNREASRGVEPATLNRLLGQLRDSSYFTPPDR
jgi:carbon storage regulator